MGIVQIALSKLFAPSVTPLTDRITALEAAMTDLSVLTDEDRAILTKAAALITEFETLAAGTIETPPPATGDGTVTVPEIQ